MFQAKLADRNDIGSLYSVLFRDRTSVQSLRGAPVAANGF